MKNVEVKCVDSSNVYLYTCYSLNLRNFLYSKGIKYRIAARHPNKEEMFWIYVRDEKLDNALTEWSANR